MSENPFRVIVVGGGPIGLILGHILTAAKIDFIILERNTEIVQHRGTAIILNPPTVRLFHQLGLYEKWKDFGTQLTGKTEMLSDGQPLSAAPYFEILEDSFGYAAKCSSRGQLIQFLYENLPDREFRIRTGAELEDIETTDEGARVHLTNGDTVHGSLVIASDGVHSKTRDMFQSSSIQRLDHKALGGGHQKPIRPMVTSVRTIGGRASLTNDRMGLGYFWETHAPGKSVQTARLKDATYFAVYDKLAQPTQERKRFTIEEMEQVAQDFAETEVSPGIKFKDLWLSRDYKNTVCVYQEEGLLDKWHHGCIAVAGEAVCKTTSASGQGVNSGANMSVVLVNKLVKLLREAANPSGDKIGEMLAQWQDDRKGEAEALCMMGKAMTRFMIWDGPNDEALDRSTPGRLMQLIEERALPALARGQLLDFIPFEGHKGEVPWLVSSIPHGAAEV
ncbi:FAD/NAD(P)-binding domain-containing protein [Xylariaceae sp. FL1272]|nr:FAD/NAD(P)-binding domain-containing protein [Xylariaceae sp. FL1272]